ncbi:MAG TPA: hypothetical protein VNX28_16920 [Gemmataceae bacterium]|nr:hypothetical protein [Gemmataceae bacterium]
MLCLRTLPDGRVRARAGQGLVTIALAVLAGSQWVLIFGVPALAQRISRCLHFGGNQRIGQRILGLQEKGEKLVQFRWLQ